MKLLKTARMWALIRLIGDSPVAANLTIRGELDISGHDGLIMNNYIDGTDYREPKPDYFWFRLAGVIAGLFTAIYLFKS